MLQCILILFHVIIQLFSFAQVGTLYIYKYAHVSIKISEILTNTEVVIIQSA